MLDIVKNRTQEGALPVAWTGDFVKIGNESKKREAAQAHALFYQGLKALGGNESQNQCCVWKNIDELLCGECYGCKIYS